MFNIQTQQASKRAEVVAKLRSKLSKDLYNTMMNTKSLENLRRGVTVTVKAINTNDINEPETMTVYNFEQLEALKALVSLDGQYDVEVTLESAFIVARPNPEIFGMARHKIETFIKLCSEFEEVPAKMVAFLINKYHGEDNAKLYQYLQDINEDYGDFIVYTESSYSFPEDSFTEFLEMHEDLCDVPTHIQNYIDFTQMLKDRLKNDIHLQKLDDGTWLVVPIAEEKAYNRPYNGDKHTRRYIYRVTAYRRPNRLK